MKYMKFVYILVFTPLKKKYRRFEYLFCHHGQTLDTRTIKTCSLKIFRKQSITMASEQTSISLDSRSHAFKAAISAPLTAMVPKKPTKSKKMTSDQKDSGKTP